MVIRDARPGDETGIAEIHNDAVANSLAIWSERQLEPRTLLAWMLERQRTGFPVLVAVDKGDNVLGYASFAQMRVWEGYRHTVENSVYVRRDQRGKGIGKALMLALIARARTSGKHVMVAAIEAGNLESIRLHEQFGFRKVGHLNEVGFKFGRWLDLALLQLDLDGWTDPRPSGEQAADGS